MSSSTDPSDAASGPVRPIVFLHLPKTAGTTLKAIIEDVYTPGKVLNLRVAQGGVRRLFTMPPAERARFDVVAGHLDWRVTRLLPGARVITVLRDPVDRFLSWFYYALRNENAPLHAELNELGGDVGRAVESGRYAPQYNIMTEMLRDQAAAGPDAALESAKRNLASCAAFGLSERFTESVRLMERTLGWPATEWEDRNVTANRPRVEDLSDDARAALEAGCAPDRALYDYAASLFDERLAS
tara:strand:+ start:68 stop:793 length:726 start_codon:yes stop_codon:yes gene_type:complete